MDSLQNKERKKESYQNQLLNKKHKILFGQGSVESNSKIALFLFNCNSTSLNSVLSIFKGVFFFH